MGAQQQSGERPSKRPHLVHTLYSTLAKYGIKTGQSTPSVYPFHPNATDFNSESFAK
jgi:hypothetical protein